MTRFQHVLRAAAIFACGTLLMSVSGNSSAQTIAVIPGDQDTQTMVHAISEIRKDPALSRLQFRVIPQAIVSAEDLQAVASADVVIARHMIGEPAVRMAAAFESLSRKKARVFGAGANDGVGTRLGIKEDTALRAYMDAGGSVNLQNMLRFVLQRELGLGKAAPAPQQMPTLGLWNPHTREIYTDVNQYATSYLSKRPQSANHPWVALAINRGQAISGVPGAATEVSEALEKRGINVMPFFGFPAQNAIEALLLKDGPRIEAVVSMAMKVGNVPDKIGPILRRLDVPLINAITLAQASKQEWENSPIGLDLAERSWQVAGPEFAGIVAPTVVATRERRVDAATGLIYVAEVTIPERLVRLSERTSRLIALRSKPPEQKRIAVLYYNSPPGNENIGASYLNVMPKSLWQILQRLEQEGYDTRGRPSDEQALFNLLHKHGSNIGSWTPGALHALVASGNATVLSMSEYRTWFDALPKKLRDQMVRAWGEPEDFKTMVWMDSKGKKYFVFPTQKFGKLLFSPQPARGWGDVKKQYHDTQLPPHHQYVAFYLWLQKSFGADAMVHVGTHGTHEWLSGKEVGFTEADPSEIIVGAVPQVYPYIVDVVGEGLQAKRRGMATIISHMTPPFDAAGLDPDMAALRGLLDDYQVAKGRSGSASQAIFNEIEQRARTMGLLKNLGVASLDAENIEKLQTHVEDIGQSQVPMGLHTFGVAPNKQRRLATARAMVARQGELSKDEFDRRVTELSDLLRSSADAELDALVVALKGHYVSAGPGGDPLRNPDSLPTGRNFYGFDPARLPTTGVYEQGRVLAEQLLKTYRDKHGHNPKKLLFSLWSNETMRHEGVIESQILYLMGIRPTWNALGRVTGLEVIPRTELNRARVDVTITPSGLYRDALPTLMNLLDGAVSLASKQNEPDNAIRQNVATATSELRAQGIDDELAERIASVRLFTLPPGAYGTGLGEVISSSNTWNSEADVAETYMRRMGHLFGQGFWGEAPSISGKADEALARSVFRGALKDVQGVVHSRASNLYGVLDNDDVFQFMGGASLAVRQAGGDAPDALIVNIGDASKPRTESLDATMGSEMRSRYLNPKWIDAMLSEGYAGARTVMQVTQNLWGWQVTVPDSVDSAKWQAMYETYVQDKHELGIRERFRAADNMRAYQSMVDRMLVAVNKGYWKADAATIAALNEANQAAIREAGVACNPQSCSSIEVARQGAALDKKVRQQANAGFGMESTGPAPTQSRASTSPTLPAPPTARPEQQPDTPPMVKGQELKEVKPSEVPNVPLQWMYAVLMLAVVLAGITWQAWRHSFPHIVSNDNQSNR